VYFNPVSRDAEMHPNIVLNPLASRFETYPRHPYIGRLRRRKACGPGCGQGLKITAFRVVDRGRCCRLRSLKRSILLITVVLAASLLSVSLVVSCASQASQTAVPELDAVEHLLELPLVRQATDYTCGAACLMSVLAYFGKLTREDSLAQELGSCEESGTDYRMIIEYARREGLTAEALEGMTLETLERYIDEGKPVQCVIQAWSDSPEHYAADVDDGHWVIAVGYDADRFYFMDPSTLGHYTYIPRPEFEERWHDMDEQGKMLEHFGIVYGGSPAYDPQEIKKLQ
jgi:predicted double-glycine peptidase